MKYMLMMTGPWDEVEHFGMIGSWPADGIKDHIEFMQELNQELTDSGELVEAQGLSAPNEAKVVRARTDGPPAVTDGPFPEMKEFLAGYWIVECETTERAVEIAARASTAPAPGGIPMNMPIQVRPVMEAGPTDDLSDFAW